MSGPPMPSMFRFLGQFVTRAWALLLVGWVILVVVSWLAAPPWRDVAQDKEFAFLPKDAPSRRAQDVFAKAFPDERLGSNVALVLVAKDSGRLDRVKKFVDDLVQPRP